MYLFKLQVLILISSLKLKLTKDLMQLTKHTDYAFRILIFLASLEKNKLTTIQQLTESFSISKSHAMKIVNKLVHQNWVEATRGKNGGVRLGVSANEITLRNVVDLMEKTLDPVNCDSPLCALKSACQLKGILCQAQELYLSHLDNYTLEDLANHQTTDVIRSFVRPVADQSMPYIGAPAFRGIQ